MPKHMVLVQVRQQVGAEKTAKISAPPAPATATTGGGGAERERRTPAASRGGGVLAFADGLDVLLMALGTLGAVADGCSYNLLLAFISDVVNSLGRGAAATTTTSGGARFTHEVNKVR
nr:unnamed protein product [Digitaria exilis]